jgi:hypothetical protein
MPSPNLETLREMQLKHGPAMLLIAMHYPTRKVLNIILPLNENDPEIDVPLYIYMGVI